MYFSFSFCKLEKKKDLDDEGHAARMILWHVAIKFLMYIS